MDSCADVCSVNPHKLLGFVDELLEYSGIQRVEVLFCGLDEKLEFQDEVGLVEVKTGILEG